jgi:hypothetical protein
MRVSRWALEWFRNRAYRHKRPRLPKVGDTIVVGQPFYVNSGFAPNKGMRLKVTSLSRHYFGFWAGDWYFHFDNSKNKAQTYELVENN